MQLEILEDGLITLLVVLVLPIIILRLAIRRRRPAPSFPIPIRRACRSRLFLLFLVLPLLAAAARAWIASEDLVAGFCNPGLSVQSCTPALVCSLEARAAGHTRWFPQTAPTASRPE